jgi:long-chain fatty acid transport protein
VHWSVLQAVNVQFSPTGPGSTQPILPNQGLPFEFRSAFRGAVGTEYFHDDTWTFRGGLAFDQSPVTDSNRNARLPDSNRILLSVGVGYQVISDMAVDLAYTHVFQPWSSTLDQTGTGTTLTGHYDSSADLFGIQITLTFDKGIPLFGYTI